MVFFGNLIADPDKINKEYLLKHYGFFIERKPAGEDGLMPVNLRIVSQVVATRSDVYLSYDDYHFI